MAKTYVCYGGSALLHLAFSKHPDHYDMMLEFAKSIGKEEEAKQDMVKLLQSVDPKVLIDNIEQLEFRVNTIETVFSPVIESNKSISFSKK